MTIWILAVLFVASLAGLGLRQGAIRVAASLIGIVLGALLAEPLGNLLKPLFGMVGVRNPALLWFLPPVIVFLIVLTLAKVGGLFLHKKVEVYYKYKAGDLRLALWERLNSRVGLCLGSLNALAYVVLLAQGIYMISYWTYQAKTDNDPRSVRLVNRLGKDLESTGMSKVAKSVDDTSVAYYEAADVAGLLFQTPQLQTRLSRYPGILSLAERPELQELANDAEFAGMRERGASITEILNYPRTQAILNNADLVKNMESSLVPNLKDIRTFLETGASAKYKEPVLGRWTFDVSGTLTLLRRDKPNMTSKEMTQRRNLLNAAGAQAELIVTPEQQLIFKNVPVGSPTSLALRVLSLQGEWKGVNGNYTFSVTIDGKTERLMAEIQGSRLNITGGDLMGLAFSHGD